MKINKQIIFLLSLLAFSTILRASQHQAKITSKQKSKNHQKSHIQLKNQNPNFPQTQNFTLDDLRMLETEFRLTDNGKKRFTKDGRQCASAFVQNGQTYRDCTSTRSPDGKQTNQEWCYVDPNAGGNPNWGFCKPILDYDKVRQKTRELVEEETVETRKVAQMVSDQILPITQTLSELERLKKEQDKVDLRVNQAEKTVDNINKNYEQMENIREQWHLLDQKNSQLDQELSNLESSFPDGDVNKNPRNCDGLLGYENEGVGDGAKGFYYDNEEFMGVPVKRIDPNINFQWEEESPAPGINFENFSIKWLTWLRVPKTGKYRFKTESDDGNMLILNGKIIIKHFMDQGGENWLNSGQGNIRSTSGNELNKILGKIQSPNTGQNQEVNRNSEQIEAWSDQIQLIGGQKYKLEIMMYHSVHNEEKENGRAYIHLLWDSNEFGPEIIKEEYLYTSMKPPSVKISGYDPKEFELTLLQENINAFKDSENFKLQDIPIQFQGMPFLRSKQDYSKDSLQFTTTGPMSLYIAVNANQDNPLPNEFEDMQEGISVLKIVKIAGEKEKKTIQRAIQSTLYKIFKKQISDGVVDIPLSLSQAATNMIIFYQLDPQATAPLSCGGSEMQISQPNNDYFSSCSQSSKIKQEGWDCEAGFSGKMQDNKDSMWRADNQGLGAWIELRLKQKFQITKIEVKNRANPGERNSKIMVEMGDKQQLLLLKNVDSVQKFTISPQVITGIVRLTINGVYTTQNNGGAFNIYGVPCEDPNKLQDDDEDGQSGQSLSNQKNPILLKCSDNLINKEEILSLGLKSGDRLLGLCSESCAQDSSKIYGDMKYSEDSSICKSAFHSGVLSNDGGKITIIIEQGESSYKSNFRNGITSYSKGQTILSMRFERAEQSSDISDIVKVGQKVDVFEESLKQWVAGIIDGVQRKNSKQILCIVSVENLQNLQQLKIIWPNEDRITYCGKRLPDRVCDAMSKEQNSKQLSVKISFGPSEAPLGFISDKGDSFGFKNGFYYGWSRDMRNQARKRNLRSDALLDNLILFNPDPQSSWCKVAEPKQSCERVDWLIQVPNDKYNVRVTMGDPAFNVMLDLVVNQKRLRKEDGKKIVLQKNQFYTSNDEIKVSNGKIIVRQQCEEQCDYSWARISAIEINTVPDSEQIDQRESSLQTRKLGCGDAYQGGRCLDESQNVENCVYNDVSIKTLKYCSGNLLLVKIPMSYICKDQIGKYKCIRREYKSAENCKQYCPGNCNGILCKPAQALDPSFTRQQKQ